MPVKKGQIRQWSPESSHSTIQSKFVIWGIWKYWPGDGPDWEIRYLDGSYDWFSEDYLRDYSELLSD